MRIGNTIYLDHQASTPLDSQVFGAMRRIEDRTVANPHASDHALGWDAAKLVDEAAADIAECIGADADEIVFTSGATEANNLALQGLCHRGEALHRDTILAVATDHKSVLAVGRALHGRRMQFVCARVSSDGHVDLDDLREKLSDRVLLVSVSLVNSEIGTIQNLSAIASLVRGSGAILHWDAAQAACALDLRTLSEAADLASFSGHKIYGPKGIGALYIQRRLQSELEPLIYGGGQQRNLRSGTVPTPLCVGMSTAFGLLKGERGLAERIRVASLRDSLIRQIKDTGWPVVVNGSGATRHPGNANLQFVGFSAHELLGLLQPHVAASMGSACSTGIPEPSHVLRAIGLDDLAASSSIRFSIGRHTTQQDIDQAVHSLSNALRRMSDAGLREVG